VAARQNPTVTAATAANASSPRHDPKASSRQGAGARPYGECSKEKSLLRGQVGRRRRWRRIWRLRLGEPRYVRGDELGHDVNGCSDHAKRNDEAYENTDEKLDHSAGPPAKPKLKLDRAGVQSLEA
jgi:hypothetical protein